MSELVKAVAFMIVLGMIFVSSGIAIYYNTLSVEIERMSMEI